MNTSSTTDKWRWNLDSTEEGVLYFSRYNTSLFPEDENFNYSLEEVAEFYDIFDKNFYNDKAPLDRIKAKSFCKEKEIQILKLYNKLHEKEGK